MEGKQAREHSMEKMKYSEGKKNENGWQERE